MKKVLLGWMLMVVFSGAVQGASFTIAPGSGGATEPLDPGDNVEIATSEGFAGFHYSDGWFRLYYDGNVLGEVRFTNHAFYVSGDQLIGEEPLNVGYWTWADEVDMHIAVYMVPHQYHFYSSNRLAVQPTTEPLPSLSLWGLIVLLILVPGVMFLKR